MDAVEYLTELNRMCKKSNLCVDCPIYRQTKRNCGLAYNNAEMLAGHVKIVEQWAKENPVETRQSVFLERYPNATIDASGNIGICPAAIEGKNCNDICNGTGCGECRSNYWSEEVTNG